MTTALNANQLYRLNDVITAILAEFGWTARDDDDDTQLNDLVLDIAATFFPERDVPARILGVDLDEA